MTAPGGRGGNRFPPHEPHARRALDDSATPASPASASSIQGDHPDADAGGPEYISAKEAARRAGCSRDTIVRAIEEYRSQLAGRPPSRHGRQPLQAAKFAGLNGPYSIRLDWFDDWLERCKLGPATSAELPSVPSPAPPQRGSFRALMGTEARGAA